MVRPDINIRFAGQGDIKSVESLPRGYVLSVSLLADGYAKLLQDMPADVPDNFSLVTFNNQRIIEQPQR